MVVFPIGPDGPFRAMPLWIASTTDISDWQRAVAAAKVHASAAALVDEGRASETC